MPEAMMVKMRREPDGYSGRVYVSWKASYFASDSTLAQSMSFAVVGH